MEGSPGSAPNSGVSDLQLLAEFYGDGFDLGVLRQRVLATAHKVPRLASRLKQ